MRMKTKLLYVLFSIVLLSGLCAFLYWEFVISREIPPEFVGNWVLDKAETIALNKPLAGWKSEYEVHMLNLKDKTGYHIETRKIGFMINGKGSLSPVLSVKKLTAKSILVICDDMVLKKRVELSLILENSNILKMKSIYTQFYHVYKKE